jgi:propanol-preferring alcohol dehydrogenase
MKAAILKAFGTPLAIEDVDDPRPGPGEVAIAIKACGIDGTDLKLLNGFGYTPDLPFVMGHEAAGVIDSVGAGVTVFAPGERVIPYNFLVPPTSAWYQTEREQISPDMQGVIGVKGHGGGFAERLVLPAHQIVRIPDGIGWADAAVHGDAGLTAWHAVRRARLALGETVLVIGVGGVGSFAVQFARLAGARVIATDRTEAKHAWARELGVVAAIVSDDPARAVRTLTGGRGVDCVIDIVGTEETMSAGIDSLVVGGRLVIVGYTPESLTIGGKRLAQKELEIIGSRAGSRHDLVAALTVSASGRIRSIVTDLAPLSGVNVALEKLRSGAVLGRLVLDISGVGAPGAASPAPT